MQQDDPWTLNAPGPDTTVDGASASEPASLAGALLALHIPAAPVFAVLDGAQFDNLPQELLLGGFVSRPLYLDRGDNNPEQVVTAPHLVWLDERLEKPGARAPDATIPALLSLIAGRPAAVFWQCAAGADTLYRHLRGINMVHLPRAALTEADRRKASAEVEPALLRHADANVLAQLLSALVPQDLARLFGPAEAVLCAPAPVWSPAPGPLVVPRSDDLPRPIDGIWRISPSSIAAMERYRENCLRRKALNDFGPAMGLVLTADRRSQVLAAFDRGLSYGLEEMKDIWGFITLDLEYGRDFERAEEFSEALYELTNVDQAPASRIHYARLACENVRIE